VGGLVPGVPVVGGLVPGVPVVGALVPGAAVVAVAPPVLPVVGGDAVVVDPDGPAPPTATPSDAGWAVW
jgi:hypothetical protein